MNRERARIGLCLAGAMAMAVCVSVRSSAISSRMLDVSFSSVLSTEIADI